MPHSHDHDDRWSILTRNLWLIVPGVVIFAIDGWLFRRLSDQLAAAIGAVGLIGFIVGVARVAAGLVEASSSASRKR